jgi:hypothetical protein
MLLFLWSLLLAAIVAGGNIPDNRVRLGSVIQVEAQLEFGCF